MGTLKCAVSEAIGERDLGAVSAFPIGDLLARSAERYGEADAVEFYGRTFTYQELFELSQKAAKGLQLLGVRPMDHVGIRLRNSPHFLIAFFGCLMAGCTAVVLSPLVPERQIRKQMKDARVKCLITSADLAESTTEESQTVLCNLRDFLPNDEAWSSIPTSKRPKRASDLSFEKLVDNDGAYEPCPCGDPQDAVAAILFTGGTTGESKGVMLTHYNFCAATETWEKQLTSGSCSGRDKLLCALPLFHVFGLTVAFLASIRGGIEIVLRYRFDPTCALDDIQEKNITIVLGVPTMYSLLVNHPAIGGYDLSSLRYCAVGGAPVPESVVSAMKAKTGIWLRTAYALTETTSTGSHQLRIGEPVMPTVGFPAPLSIVEVVDLETGMNLLTQGEQGEICFRGPYVTKGYWNRPDATLDAFRGGRFHTGDIGYLTDSGYLVIVDRKKDMLLCGGHNVFPRNIETALYEHPAIDEVCVIGVPDEMFGERPKAFIVLHGGCAVPDHGELVEFLSRRLARYEIPTKFEIRSHLPKTPVGKLSKKDLIDEELAVSHGVTSARMKTRFKTLRNTRPGAHDE